MSVLARHVADVLRKNNITVQSFTEADDQVDGEVVINDFLHVQVGDGYFCLISEHGDEFTWEIEESDWLRFYVRLSQYLKKKGYV